jgi:putative transposase
MYCGSSATPSSKLPFLLTGGELRRLSPHFPLSHGVPRVDDRRVVSGIFYVDVPPLRCPHFSVESVSQRDGRMKRSRFSDEQIIGILKEQESGAVTAHVCRHHRISEATFYKWKAKFGGLEVWEAKRLRTLEEEKAKLVSAGVKLTQVPFEI